MFNNKYISISYVSLDNDQGDENLNLSNSLSLFNQEEKKISSKIMVNKIYLHIYKLLYCANYCEAAFSRN